MPFLAVLLALALPLGLGAQDDPGVQLDGVAGVSVDGGAVVDAPAAGLQVAAGPDGVAVQAPLVGAVDVAVPPLPLAPSEADAESASDGEPAVRDASPAWAPAPGAVAAGGAIGLGLVGLGLAHLAGLLPWFPSFSRIEDADLAKHPARRMALDFIAANPGATLQDVRRGLGLAWGTTVHHLGRLERAGLVAVRHVGGRRCHFPLGQAPPRDALAAPQRSLAVLVRERPGLAQAELARLAGLQPPTVSKQLARLEAAGLVAAQRVGRSRLYVPTASLAAAVPA